MTDAPTIPEPDEVLVSLTPSPFARYLLAALVGVLAGVALGWAVAGVLASERAGHYAPLPDEVEKRPEPDAPEPEAQEPEPYEVEPDDSVYDDGTVALPLEPVEDE